MEVASRTRTAAAPNARVVSGALACPSARALQVLDARDGVAIEAILSIKEPTRIRIEGHTDSQGVHIYNIDLSQRRAKSVRTWLIQHGIAELRLQAEGFGPDRPLVPNATPAGRAKNRRVEFHIVEGTGGTAIQP